MPEKLKRLEEKLLGTKNSLKMPRGITKAF